MIDDSDKVLSKEAVVLVAEYLKSLQLTPYRFSSQIALCQLLEIADSDPYSDVAQWILAAPRTKLWMSDGSGKLVEGDEPRYVCFRDAWQDFLLNEFPTM